jgi:hypothetical protein
MIERAFFNRLTESGIEHAATFSNFASIVSVIGDPFSKFAKVGSELRLTFSKFVVTAAVIDAHFSEISAGSSMSSMVGPREHDGGLPQRRRDAEEAEEGNCF